MTKEHTPQPEPPHGNRDRGISDEKLSKKGSRKSGGGSHDPEAQGYEADKTFTPDRDGSRS